MQYMHVSVYYGHKFTDLDNLAKHYSYIIITSGSVLSYFVVLFVIPLSILHPVRNLS